MTLGNRTGQGKGFGTVRELQRLALHCCHFTHYPNAQHLEGMSRSL
jgi:hypothetical protein